MHTALQFGRVLMTPYTPQTAQIAQAHEVGSFSMAGLRVINGGTTMETAKASALASDLIEREVPFVYVPTGKRWTDVEDQTKQILNILA